MKLESLVPFPKTDRYFSLSWARWTPSTFPFHFLDYIFNVLFVTEESVSLIFSKFRNVADFVQWRILIPPLKPKKRDDGHLSAVRDRFFNVFAANVRTLRPSSISKSEDASRRDDRDHLTRIKLFITYSDEPSGSIKCGEFLD